MHIHVCIYVIINIHAYVRRVYGSVTRYLHGWINSTTTHFILYTALLAGTLYGVQCFRVEWLFVGLQTLLGTGKVLIRSLSLVRSRLNCQIIQDPEVKCAFEARLRMHTHTHTATALTKDSYSLVARQRYSSRRSQRLLRRKPQCPGLRSRLVREGYKLP